MKREIRYDRFSKDFQMTLNNEIVGYARTYLEAETTLDALVYALLTKPPTETVAWVKLPSVAGLL